MPRSTSGARPAAVALIGVAFLGLIYLGNRRWRQHQHLREAAQAFADFRACLYGEPLAPDEKGSDRLRAIELCALKQDGPNAGWPRTCEAPLRQALSAFDALDVKEDHPTYGPARKMARIASEWRSEMSIWLVGDGPLGEGASIDRFEEAIARAHLPFVETSEPVKKCTARARFGAADVTPLGPTGAYRVETERALGQALRVVWGDESGLACWFSPTGDAVARCGTIKLANVASPLSSDEGVRELFVWDFDSKAEKPYAIVSPFSAKTLIRMDSLNEHGWARQDGSIIVSTLTRGLFTIRDGEATALSTPLPKQSEWLAVRPGWLFWGEAAQGSKQVVAKGVRLGTSNPAVITLGDAPARPLVRACRTPAGELVPVLLSRSGELIHEGNLTLQAVELRSFFPDGQGRFSAAVTHSMRLAWGSGMFDPPDVAAQFACAQNGSPRWVWMQNQMLHALTCTPTGCEEQTSKPIQFPAIEINHFQVAPLGDSAALLVYDGAYQGPVVSLGHAVRVRVAPVSEIADAPDTVLIADERYGGLEKLYEAVFAFGRGDVGWVAVRAANRVYAFRTGVQGDFAPVRLDSR